MLSKNKYSKINGGYILLEDYRIKTNLNSNLSIIHPYITLINGELTILSEYFWNGVTGWFTTKSTLCASLIHDSLWQLMELGILPLSYKYEVDDIYRSIAIEDGGWRWWINIQRFVLRNVKVYK